MQKICGIVVFTISLLIIFEQLFKLTIFTIKYNNIYDYGKQLKNLCKNEFTEYETERYQMSLNENYLTISNLTKKNNLLNILIISIIITIVISIIYSILIYSIFSNINFDKNYTIFTKIYIFIIILLCILVILYPILTIYYKLRHNNIDLNIFKIGYNLNFFDSNRTDISYYIQIIVSITIISLILLKIISIKYKLKLPDFIIDNNYININENKELIFYIIYSIIYISIILYIGNIIELYLGNNNENKNKNSEKLNISLYINNILGINNHDSYISKIEKENIKEKKFEDVDEYYANLELNINDIKNNTRVYETIIDDIEKYCTSNDVNIIDEIIQEIIKNIKEDKNIKINKENLQTICSENYIDTIIDSIKIKIENLNDEIKKNKQAKKNNNNIKDEYEKVEITENFGKFRDSINGIIFILIIFMIIISIIYYIISQYEIKDNNYLSNNIYNYIIIPFLSLFIILFLINATYEYNKIFHKNLIKNVNDNYKFNLNEMHNQMNDILHKYKDPDYQLPIDKDDIITKINNELYKNDKDDKDDINSVQNENNKPIFYIIESGTNDPICNNLNYNNIKKLIENLLIIFDIDNDVFKKLLKHLSIIYINKERTEEEIANYIRYKIIDKNEEYKKIYDNILEKIIELEEEKIQKELINNYIILLIYNIYIISKELSKIIKDKNDNNIKKLITKLNNRSDISLEEKNALIRYVNQLEKSIENFYDKIHKYYEKIKEIDNSIYNEKEIEEEINVIKNNFNIINNNYENNNINIVENLENNDKKIDNNIINNNIRVINYNLLILIITYIICIILIKYIR